MESPNIVSGAVVLKEIPLETWMLRYATSAQKEGVLSEMSIGLVPQQASLSKDGQLVVRMEGV
jgi:hypothetical protein